MGPQQGPRRQVDQLARAEAKQDVLHGHAQPPSKFFAEVVTPTVGIAVRVRERLLRGGDPQR